MKLLKQIHLHTSFIIALFLMFFSFQKTAEAQMIQLLNTFGNYQVRADACGTNSFSCPITIEKPAGATTVHKAYIYFTTINTSGPQPAPANNCITLTGGGLAATPILMNTLTTSYNAYSRHEDVTAILGPGLNAATAGTNIVYTSAESPTTNIDGVGIIVVWNNPTAVTSAIHVSLGCENTGVLVTDNILTSPINTGIAGFRAIMGVGISFSTGGNFQSSTLSINGTVIDNAAGGLDDGATISNGSLITLGGFGDSPTLATSDEYYDFSSFIANGSTQVTYSIITSSGHDQDFIDAIYFEITGANPPNDTVYVCKGDSAILTVGRPGTNFNWYQSGTPGTSLGTNDTLIVSPTVNTQYVVTINGLNDTIDVVINPTYSFNTNASICAGDSILIGGIYHNAAGIYYDTLNTIKGCDSIIITTLSITNLPNVNIVSQNLLCYPNNANIIANSSVSGVTYSWQGPGILSGNNSASASINLAGTYTVTVTDSKGCKNTASTTVSILPGPTATVSPDITIQQGESTTLTASGGTNYNWIPPTGLNTTSGNTVIASPLQTTIYCAIVSDSSGCKDTACVKVTIDIICVVPENLGTPNAFSPNNDGINDEFCLEGWEACNDKFLILIYDRFGEKVFESNNPNFCWDGKYKGNIMDAQVFIYQINAKYSHQDKPINKRGNITLIR